MYNQQQTKDLAIFAIYVLAMTIAFPLLEGFMVSKIWNWHLASIWGPISIAQGIGMISLVFILIPYLIKDYLESSKIMISYSDFNRYAFNVFFRSFWVFIIAWVAYLLG